MNPTCDIIECLYEYKENSYFICITEIDNEPKDITITLGEKTFLLNVVIYEINQQNHYICKEGNNEIQITFNSFSGFDDEYFEMEFEPLVKQSKIQTDKTKQIITFTAFDNINIGKKQLILYVKNNKETKTTIDFDIIENEISSYLDHIPYSGQQTITLTTTNRIEEEYINQIILRKINTEIKPNKCQKDDDKILRCDFNFDINKPLSF